MQKDPQHKNALNKACYNCKLRSTIAYTDIRMGDFWGEIYSKNKEGVSAVVLYSDKGRVLFENVKDRFEIKKHKLSEVIPFQSYGKKHKLDQSMRRHTLDLLSSDLSIEEILKMS